MIVIYMIVNLVNGKVYIGSTDDINYRFYIHKYQLNNCIHHNQHLQRAWNKYGSESFEFKILMVCPEKERNHCEQMLMDLYNSQNHDFGYNIKDADGHSVAEETKLKISEALIGKPKSDKHKQKLSEAHKGNTLSDETKQKISEALTGKPKSKEHKQKLSESKWKDYPRIIKAGFYKDKQQYAVKYEGKMIKKSIDLFKLLDWFFVNYPDEDLEILMEVLDEAVFS